MGEEIELGPYMQKDDTANNSTDTLHGSDAVTHRKTGKNELISLGRDNTSEVMSLDADVEIAEVKRELKPRHVSMISLGGTIGTGLFIVTSQPLRLAGPVGSLIAYLFMATIIYSVTQSLGEMATFIPVTSSFTVFAQRFVSPAAGAASGYLYWFSWCMTFALELSVVGHLIEHWTFAVPLAAWIVIFWVILTLLNLFPVKYYGEIEFWIASIKVLSILGYLIYAFLIVCGASPQGPIGFRYWRNPGPWGTGMISEDIGLARFLGWVNTLIRAAFTYQGTELVGITAGESKNPRKAVPKAINQVFFRIIFFYILSLLFIGLLVPYDDPRLEGKSDADVNSSPFVISIQNAGTKILPDIFNGIVIMTIVSAGNSNVYVGSRVLYGLSKMRVAPAIFRVTDKRGVPYVSVLSTAALGSFAFLNVSQDAEKVFNWLLNSTAVAGFFTWLFISVSHIRFMKALKYRGICRGDLPFKANCMPWSAYYASFFIVLIIIIQGFTAFAPKFSAADFVALYISVFIFVICWLACQLLFKTKWLVPIEEIDIDTDRKEIDAMVWVESATPKTFFQRLWDNA